MWYHKKIIPRYLILKKKKQNTQKSGKLGLEEDGI